MINISCCLTFLILFQSGNEASFYILPGPGGTVYYEGEDLIQLIMFAGPILFPISQLAFYVNLHRAVIGPSATLAGR